MYCTVDWKLYYTATYIQLSPLSSDLSMFACLFSIHILHASSHILNKRRHWTRMRTELYSIYPALKNFPLNCVSRSFGFCFSAKLRYRVLKKLSVFANYLLPINRVRLYSHCCQQLVIIKFSIGCIWSGF
jgi:hypothetical protein